MQDRYLGDIGDFAKYGLLRAVAAGKPPLGLAVLWYLVPDESHNEDGRHIGYLEQTQKNDARFRPCDPELYDRLGYLVGTGRRSVSAVAEHTLLPPATVYHDEPLDYSTVPREERPIWRERWLDGALAVAAKADLVFLDPDNGLEVDSTGPYDGLGPKLTFYGDLAAMPPGKSLVIYQHATREGTFEDQLAGRMEDLRDLLGHPRADLFAMRWRRVSPRAFIFATADAHRAQVLDRLGAMLAGPGARHFELVPAGRLERV
jgi:hypothetical protein